MKIITSIKKCGDCYTNILLVIPLLFAFMHYHYLDWILYWGGINHVHNF